jgi:hypothetical protein
MTIKWVRVGLFTMIVPFKTPIADFDRLCKLEKRGDEIKKKSSPLKLLGQSQPNFAEMILGWPPSNIVSVDPDFQPRWPPSSK